MISMNPLKPLRIVLVSTILGDRFGQAEAEDGQSDHVGAEDRLGFDPFSTAEDGSFPTTIGDFIRLYEQASPGNVAA